MSAVLGADPLTASGEPDHLTGREPVALRSDGLRAGLLELRPGLAGGGDGKHPQERRRGGSRRRGEEPQPPRSIVPKLHILLPTKFSGMAAAIEIAWAATSRTPAVTSSSSTAAANRKAPTLTAKKRAA